MLWKRRVYFFKLFYLAQSLTQSRYLIRIWRRREGRERKKTQDRLHGMQKILSIFIQTTVSLQWSQSLWQIINMNQTKWLGWNFSHSSTQPCMLKPAKAQGLSCSLSNSVIYLGDLQRLPQILWLYQWAQHSKLAKQLQCTYYRKAPYHPFSWYLVFALKNST